MSFPLRKTALALALSGASLACAAQVVVNDGLDGNWFAPNAGGRGVSVDAIANEDGSSRIYGVVFTYDTAGKPLWLTMLGDVPAGQSVVDGVPVLRFEGGRFDSANPAPTSTVVGTASIDVSSCKAISLTFDMNADSGLPDATLDVAPAQVNVGYAANPLCAAAPVLAACPTGTTAEGADCLLPNSITGNLYLPAGKKYLVRGAVIVEGGGTLTVAPGVTVQGHSDISVANFIGVKQDGRIYADGTPTRPIVFTGPTPEVGSWGGLHIAGRSTCNDYVSAAEPCRFEAYPDMAFGGGKLDDSSGVLRYVRIEWAGVPIRPNEELNSLTLLGVGAGTVLDHVQVDGGKDDGFEFFGGNVNGSHLVCSNMGDDCFDFDDGYHGKLQFLLAWQGDNTDIGSDSNGIESDNSKDSPDIQPRTQPQISNITLLGSSTFPNKHGLRIRRGSGGNYANLVVHGFTDRCLALDDAATFALGTASGQGAALSMTHSFVGQCGGGAFDDSANDPYLVSAWFNATGAGNQSGDPKLNGFLPAAGSPLLQGGKSLADPFFRPVSYRGAFAGAHDDWTAGWTVGLPR